MTEPMTEAKLDELAKMAPFWCRTASNHREKFSAEYMEELVAEVKRRGERIKELESCERKRERIRKPHPLLAKPPPPQRRITGLVGWARRGKPEQRMKELERRVRVLEADERRSHERS